MNLFALGLSDGYSSIRHALGKESIMRYDHDHLNDDGPSFRADEQTPTRFPF